MNGQFTFEGVTVVEAEDIKASLVAAKQSGNSHVILIESESGNRTFINVSKGKDARKLCKELKKTSRVKAVYSLKLDIDLQLKEHYPTNFDV